MAFNHYAKMKRILDSQPPNWYIVRINQQTSALSFTGERRIFDHYYRILDSAGRPIKYCKFQQIDRLASVLGVSVEALPVVDNDANPHNSATAQL